MGMSLVLSVAGCILIRFGVGVCPCVHITIHVQRPQDDAGNPEAPLSGGCKPPNMGAGK